MPMHAMFNNELQDTYMRQTKLRQVKRGGDLQLAGEIVEYSQINKQSTTVLRNILLQPNQSEVAIC